MSHCTQGLYYSGGWYLPFSAAPVPSLSTTTDLSVSSFLFLFFFLLGWKLIEPKGRRVSAVPVATPRQFRAMGLVLCSLLSLSLLSSANRKHMLHNRTQPVEITKRGLANDRESQSGPRVTVSLGVRVCSWNIHEQTFFQIVNWNLKETLSLSPSLTKEATLRLIQSANWIRTLDSSRRVPHIDAV